MKAHALIQLSTIALFALLISLAVLALIWTYPHLVLTLATVSWNG